MSRKSTKKALYPYTLQPIALNLSDSDFRQAQWALFQKTAQNYRLSALKWREWLILGMLSTLAIAGIVLVSGYSTILFWLILAGIGVYLLLRTLGLKWYTQKEYRKQLQNQSMPQELHGMRLGVQPHGLVLTLPTAAASVQRLPRGMAANIPTQQAVIAWNDVQSWDETDDFLFILFSIKGQKGSQIIPKHLQYKQLPIDTIKKHLSTITSKGLKTND